jgi:hypothetical protein
MTRLHEWLADHNKRNCDLRGVAMPLVNPLTTTT